MAAQQQSPQRQAPIAGRAPAPVTATTTVANGRPALPLAYAAANPPAVRAGILVPPLAPQRPPAPGVLSSSAAAFAARRTSGGGGAPNGFTSPTSFQIVQPAPTAATTTMLHAPVPTAATAVAAKPVVRMCTCTVPQQAQRYVVQRDGADKGRVFYACPNPKHVSCDYIEWGPPTTASSSSSSSSPLRTTMPNATPPAAPTRVGVVGAPNVARMDVATTTVRATAPIAPTTHAAQTTTPMSVVVPSNAQATQQRPPQRMQQQQQQPPPHRGGAAPMASQPSPQRQYAQTSSSSAMPSAARSNGGGGQQQQQQAITAGGGGVNASTTMSVKRNAPESANATAPPLKRPAQQQQQQTTPQASRMPANVSHLHAPYQPTTQQHTSSAHRPSQPPHQQQQQQHQQQQRRTAFGGGGGGADDDAALMAAMDAFDRGGAPNNRHTAMQPQQQQQQRRTPVATDDEWPDATPLAPTSFVGFGVSVAPTKGPLMAVALPPPTPSRWNRGGGGAGGFGGGGGFGGIGGFGGAPATPVANSSNNNALGPQDPPLSDVKCEHGETTSTFITKKAGPNQGKRFYACARQESSGDRCKYFKWHDDLLHVPSDPLAPQSRVIMQHNRLLEGPRSRIALGGVAVAVPRGSAAPPPSSSSRLPLTFPAPTNAIVPPPPSSRPSTTANNDAGGAAAKNSRRPMSPAGGGGDDDAGGMYAPSDGATTAPTPTGNVQPTANSDRAPSRKELAMELVARLAERHDYRVSMADTYEEVYRHCDMRIAKGAYDANEVWLSVQQARKVAPSDADVDYDRVWLQLHGTSPDDDGWLVGGKANVVLFEAIDGFWVADRKALLRYADVKVMQPAGIAPRWPWSTDRGGVVDDAATPNVNPFVTDPHTADHRPFRVSGMLGSPHEVRTLVSIEDLKRFAGEPNGVTVIQDFWTTPDDIEREYASAIGRAQRLPVDVATVVPAVVAVAAATTTVAAPIATAVATSVEDSSDVVAIAVVVDTDSRGDAPDVTTMMDTTEAAAAAPAPTPTMDESINEAAGDNPVIMAAIQAVAVRSMMLAKLAEDDISGEGTDDSAPGSDRNDDDDDDDTDDDA